MSLEVNDWDQPLVKRRKLSEHTDSSWPRNADPQGDKGDGGPGDNEAYFSANFKSVCSSVLSEGSPERHVLTDDEAGIIHSFMNLPRKYKTQLYLSLYSIRISRDSLYVLCIVIVLSSILPVHIMYDICAKMFVYVYSAHIQTYSSSSMFVYF